jgi:heme-degrading monooxygenase HmoA
MLIRIVKMTFQPEHVPTFRQAFEERKARIAGFPGCNYVELLQSGHIFFTYSVWQSEEALEAYRTSELFISTWAVVKPLFAAKAEAWSLTKEYESD